jgi:hypothetical protein
MYNLIDLSTAQFHDRFLIRDGREAIFLGPNPFNNRIIYPYIALVDGLVLSYLGDGYFTKNRRSDYDMFDIVEKVSTKPLHKTEEVHMDKSINLATATIGDHFITRDGREALFLGKNPHSNDLIYPYIALVNGNAVSYLTNGQFSTLKGDLNTLDIVEKISAASPTTAETFTDMAVRIGCVREKLLNDIDHNPNKFVMIPDQNWVDIIFELNKLEKKCNDAAKQ